MNQNPKLEIVASLSRNVEMTEVDAFHEDRVRVDLAAIANSPCLFGQYLERVRVRIQKAGERAVLKHWTDMYKSGEQVIAAKLDMERRKSEYLQLAHEHELKENEKRATLARLQADIEEHGLRRDKAVYQREHLEQYVEGALNANATENEQKLNEANERRQLDARWELNESLRPLHTLIELQHWRRQQRDRVLQDRSLTPEEQTEDLQFVDDLYKRKQAEVKADVRIFEEH